MPSKAKARSGVDLARQGRKLHEQLPLLEQELIDEATHFVMSDHAIERCEERQVGILEAYSAIARPQSSYTRADGATVYRRGDLQVVTRENTILTVVDVDETYRISPRVPLNPLIARGAKVAKRSNGVSSSNADEMWCLVPHPEPDIRLVLITPTLAEKLLGLNSANRPLNRRLVATYVEEINEGRWQLTHQGVALSTDSMLLDGQHRLHAIVETGKAQQMFVAVGMADSNFAVIDTGRNRKYSDVLSLQGYSDAWAMGSTARLIYLYLHKDFVGTYRVPNSEVVNTVQADEKLFLLSMNVGRQLYKNMSFNRSAGGAGYYIIRRTNSVAATTDFFDSLITGADMHSGDPRLALRRVVANMARSKGRSIGAEHLALLIKTWNSWCDGKNDVRHLSWRRTESMPRAARFERKA